MPAGEAAAPAGRRTSSAPGIATRARVARRARGAHVRWRHFVELSVVSVASRDDVVLQRPEDVRFLVPVFHTHTACAGAATAYLLRRIAYRAGAYAPGIQEHMFHELNTS